MGYLYSLSQLKYLHIRPYLPENTGSRPLSHSQAGKGQISSWVGDDQRIPAVVCCLPFYHGRLVIYLIELTNSSISNHKIMEMYYEKLD